jgi:hypothetical protein
MMTQSRRAVAGIGDPGRVEGRYNYSGEGSLLPAIALTTRSLPAMAIHWTS